MQTNTKTIKGKTLNLAQQTEITLKVADLNALDLQQTAELHTLNLTDSDAHFGSLSIKDAAKLQSLTLDNQHSQGIALYLSHQEYPANLTLNAAINYLSLEWFSAGKRFTLELQQPEPWQQIRFIDAAQLLKLSAADWAAFSPRQLIILVGDTPGTALHLTTAAQLAFYHNQTLQQLTLKQNSQLWVRNAPQLQQLSLHTPSTECGNNLTNKTQLQWVLEHCPSLQQLSLPEPGSTGIAFSSVRLNHASKHSLTVLGHCQLLQLSHCDLPQLQLGQVEQLCLTDCAHLTAIHTHYQTVVLMFGQTPLQLQQDGYFQLNEASIATLLANFDQHWPEDNAEQALALLLHNLSHHYKPTDCRYALALLRQLQLRGVAPELLWQARDKLNYFNLKGRALPAKKQGIKPCTAWLWRLASDLEFEAMADDLAFIFTGYQQQQPGSLAIYRDLLYRVATSNLPSLVAIKLFQQQPELLTEAHWLEFWQQVLEIRRKLGSSSSRNGRHFAMASSCELFVRLVADYIQLWPTPPLAAIFSELVFYSGLVTDCLKQKEQLVKLLTDHEGELSFDYHTFLRQQAESPGWLAQHHDLDTEALRLFLLNLSQWLPVVKFSKRNVEDFARIFYRPFVIEEPRVKLPFEDEIADIFSIPPEMEANRRQ